VGVPVRLVGEGLVYAVVEVLVVREDDVAADVVEKALRRDIGGCQAAGSFVGVDNHP